MAYYYCNESDRILSVDEIRDEFEQFRSEGAYPDMSFDEYLNGCMWWNNGSLTSVPDKISILRRKLASAQRLADMVPDDPDYRDDIEEITTEIERFARYERKEQAMRIGDIPITSRFCVYAVNLGHFIYQYLDMSAPGDIPPDIASLPVVGLRSMDNVLYIDTLTEGD